MKGQHSEGREYGYIGRPLWETPQEMLPWFPDADVGDALDIAETIMKNAGWSDEQKSIRWPA